MVKATGKVMMTMFLRVVHELLGFLLVAYTLLLFGLLSAEWIVHQLLASSD